MNKKRKVTCPICLKERDVVSALPFTVKNCMSCSKKVPRNIITYFNTIDCPKKSYIFGFLWADGYQNKYTIKIELKKEDLSVLEFIKKEIGYGSIYYRKRIDKRFKKVTESYTLNISSMYLSKKLKELDFRTSLNKLPKEYYLDFLRGFLDGDGCISYYKKSKSFSIFFSSNSEENWEHIKIILNIYNMKYSIIKKQSSSNLRLLGKDTEKFNFLEKLYNTKDFYLKRKKEKYNEYRNCKEKNKWIKI